MSSIREFPSVYIILEIKVNWKSLFQKSNVVDTKLLITRMTCNLHGIPEYTDVIHKCLAFCAQLFVTIIIDYS